MNKDTRGSIKRLAKIDLRENYLLDCQFFCTFESCIFIEDVRAKLDRGTIV